MKQLPFIDSVKVFVRAGNGGGGSASFRREKFIPRGGPDGGDGGDGGDVIFVANRHDNSLTTLRYSPHIKAEHGGHGKGKVMYGRCGKDTFVRVPCGTEVREAESGRLIADLVRHGEEVIVARGGKGGLGNCHWKTSTHQAPREHTAGGEGEEKTLQLELKLIADVGLVGYPNAGKSSLLSRLTQARPKVAAYPFTTLGPIVGTLTFDDYSDVKIADIPGLIEGAHKGRGLGHAFLRHIERCTCLVFVIDMAGTDGNKPAKDYLSLLRELELHKKGLSERPSLVAANKMDLPEARDSLREFADKTGMRPLEVSALTGAGIDELKAELFRMVRSG